MKAKRIN